MSSPEAGAGFLLPLPLTGDFTWGKHHPGILQLPSITPWPQGQLAGTGNIHIWEADEQVCILPLDKALHFSDFPSPYLHTGMRTPVLPAYLPSWASCADQKIVVVRALSGYLSAVGSGSRRTESAEITG